MQVFLHKSDEVFNVSEFVRADYDGFTLRIYFHGELVSSHEANLGDCFFVTSNGSKKLPTVVKAELPNSRGAKIAWALSFVGESKYVENGNEFWNHCQKISDENTLSNIIYLVSPGVYALCIADRVSFSKKPESKLKVKVKNPILAWISDEITESEIDELVERFSQERGIFCPVEYLKVL